MTKTAFLFPGQGSQYVGMAKDLYEAYPEVRETFDKAESVLEISLKSLCFDGPEDDLKQTRYTQPAIFTHSLAVDGLLKKHDIYPGCVAGHSLGEYSALVSAGALSFEDGLRLVKIRGELMQISGEKNPGTMAAIIGATTEIVAEACAEAASAGIVQPANYNCPGQLVISGSIPGVHRAMELAKKKGARIVKELTVSGAFHSPLMEDALAGLVQALDDVEIHDTKIPVYSNVAAKPITSGDEMRELLKRQLLSPVLWENIIRNMISDGVTQFYEVGPGQVLRGLLRRIDRKYVCQAVGEVDEIRKIGEKKDA